MTDTEPREHIIQQRCRDFGCRFLKFASTIVFIAITLPVRAQTVEDLRLLPKIGESTTDSSVDPVELIPLPTEDASSEEIIVTDVSPSDAAPPPSVVDGGVAWIPSTWFTGPIWEYGAELGINGSAGNAEALSIVAGANAKRETEGNVFLWNLKYGKSQTGGIETQHFALFDSRWDLKISDVRLMYNKNTLEYDEFKAFDIRIAVSGGLGHRIVDNERTSLTARLGAGTSREFGGPDDSYVPEANMGIDFEHKLTIRQRVKLTSDYYPSWEDQRDYRLVTDAFWEITIDESAGLSLKVGAVDRYDSTPNSRKHNDIDYFTTLIWKR